MPKSLAVGLAGLVLVLGACSSNSPAASTPAGGDGGDGGAQPTATIGSGATEPGSGDQTGAPFSGDIKDIAHKLAPDGSTETGNLDAQGIYQLYVTTTLSLDQIKAFYAQRIPSLGMTIAANVESSGSLYLSTTNPVGAIIAAPDTTAGAYTIAISLSSQ